MDEEIKTSPVAAISKGMARFLRREKGVTLSADDLEKAFRYALSFFDITESAEGSLVISGKKETRILEGKDILYIERKKRDTYIYTEAESLRIPERLSSLEEHLPMEMFIRCHNSFIVNMAYVKECTKEGFRMKNDEIIPISRSRQKAVREAFRLWACLRRESV